MHSTISFLLVLLLPASWILAVRWLQKGRFTVLEDSPGRFVFRSDCGHFTLHHASGTLAWKQRGRSASTKLAEVKGIDYLANEGGALAQELLSGFDLTDLFRPYQDSIEYHAIDIITVSQLRVPVFRGARWQRREFLAGWLIALEDYLLVRTGLLRDVERQAGRALELLQARLGKDRVWR